MGNRIIATKNGGFWSQLLDSEKCRKIWAERKSGFQPKIFFQFKNISSCLAEIFWARDLITFAI